MQVWLGHCWKALQHWLSAAGSGSSLWARTGCGAMERFVCPSQLLWSMKMCSWGMAELHSHSSQKPDHSAAFGRIWSDMSVVTDHQYVLNSHSLILISLFLFQKIHTKYAAFMQTGWCPCPPRAIIPVWFPALAATLLLCHCPQLQPTKAHKSMSHKLGITKYQGLQWDHNLDHTPPIKKERQRQDAEGLSEKHVLPAGPP